MIHSTNGVKVALHVEVLSSSLPFFSQDLRECLSKNITVPFDYYFMR